MTDYRFLTRWHIVAPIDGVYDALLHSERWPSWWRGVESVVELAAGDDDGLGNKRRYVWKSRLPYRLVFEVTTTRVERPVALEGRAEGELEGTGRWRLAETGAATRVDYAWEVRTTERWMNLLAPLVRPVFAWNHDVVMRWGGEGLGRLLGAPLVHMGRDGADFPPVA